jgi:large subunit ribosomal protein L9
MKVIFIKDVPTVARRHDVKEVSDGYARNFLFLKGLAKPATENSLKSLRQELTEKHKKGTLQLNQAHALAERLKTTVLHFKSKVGEKGKSFGSISAAKIQEELQKKGIEVKKEDIELEDPIKSTGEKLVLVRLHPEVTEGVKIIVESETEPTPKKK